MNNITKSKWKTVYLTVKVRADKSISNKRILTAVRNRLPNFGWSLDEDMNDCIFQKVKQPTVILSRPMILTQDEV